MAQKEETGSPGWTTSFFVQTREDVAKAVADAAAAIAVHSQSPRPSVVFQSKDENSGNQLQKLRNQFSRVFKGFSHPTETKRITYNPEVLTSQKRQWARFQLQSLDQKSFKEPTRLFESIAVVGLHPNCDNQALQKLLFARKSEGSGKIRSALSGHFNSRVEPYLEPQVLFVYPPEKQLPLKHKDLLSFCFPGGIEVHAVEKTPSMSELNEILLGQEHLKQSDLSFVFRLQVADSSTLYGCCVLVEEIVQKPSRLVSMMSHNQPLNAPLSRHVITTQRCYCLLSRLPFFELHFGVLNSIFTEERFERLTQSICGLDMGISEMDTKLSEEDIRRRISFEDEAEDGLHEAVRNTALCDISSDELADGESCVTNADTEENSHSYNGKSIDSPASVVCNSDIIQHEEESPVSLQNSEVDGICSNHCEATKKMFEKSIPDAVWPLLRYQYESSESSSSLQGSPCEGRQFRSEIEDAETEETSSSGRDDSVDHDDILEWVKANNLGSLQIICEYFRLSTPARGSTLEFHPLEHLQPLEFKRPDGGALNIDGQLIDLRSCSTSLEMAEVYNEILAEEEATALSVWAISCLCGFLRLENVLTLFAGALLEKQVVVVCSNLGVLSALVLSIVPLIRPYRWQSLLMPVLPNDMLDFLDAPVPYIVGVKSKTSEVQSKTSAILVDLNKNQVRSPSMPQLPRQKELLASLSPYHSKLVGESYLGKRRPFYDCTDVQAEAAKGFLAVLREYLDSLCSNLRSHTITNVQSNDDKVSLLLKDSFIGSFTNRDRPFMKLFVDTQLFSVHTDLALSFYQKD